MIRDNNINLLLHENKIDEVVNIIGKLNKVKYNELIKELITELGVTTIANIRNSIAIVLSDLQCNEAVEPLVLLVKSSKCINCRGTLIYALQGLESSNHIVDLFPLIFEGNYETKSNLFTLLESKINNMTKLDIDICINMLIEKINKYEEDLQLFYDIGENILGIDFDEY